MSMALVLKDLGSTRLLVSGVQLWWSQICMTNFTILLINLIRPVDQRGSALVLIGQGLIVKTIL